ncbi:MAG TPA: hypothetical protein VD993_06885 [Chitinophagaceae bacterium]|nr:hypothetical protein [Chitinophagaceae bacterium]
MEQSLSIYRFALWGILGVILLHAVYYSAVIFQAPRGFRSMYINAVMAQFLIYSIILMLEMLVYWIIRRRLYRVVWVRLHIITLWAALVLIPLVYVCLYYFLGDAMSPERFSHMLAAISAFRTVVFWGGLVVGHLFFIATIVKSFSKKQAPAADATNTPDILDEFTQ